MLIVEEGCLPAAVRFLLRGSLVAQEYSAGLILNLATNRYPCCSHQALVNQLNRAQQSKCLMMNDDLPLQN